MKTILSVKANGRKRAFEVEISDAGVLEFPFSICEAVPTPGDPIVELFVDEELGSTGFTYRLRSGSEGSVLSDHVLWQNRDPDFMLELHLHNLTCKALDRFEQGYIGLRALSRKLKTSPSQVYRLLDTTNFKKSMDQMLRLLNALNVEVELVVRDAPIAPLSVPR